MAIKETGRWPGRVAESREQCAKDAENDTYCRFKKAETFALGCVGVRDLRSNIFLQHPSARLCRMPLVRSTLSHNIDLSSHC